MPWNLTQIDFTTEPLIYFGKQTCSNEKNESLWASLAEKEKRC